MSTENFGTRLRGQLFREKLEEELTRAKKDRNFAVAIGYGTDRKIYAKITIGSDAVVSQAVCDSHNLTRPRVRDALRKHVTVGSEQFFADHNLSANNRASSHFILYKGRLCDLKAVARVSLGLAADDRLANTRDVAQAVHKLGFTQVHFVEKPLADCRSVHLMETTGNERDGLPYGRSGEGPNHRRLRLWTKRHPRKVVDRLHVDRSETEVPLESGDRVDVVYYAEGKTVVVEVKSIDSDEDDIRRGIYQCVKYKAVKRAHYRALGIRCSVRSLLVTERALDGELKQIAERLKVEWRAVSVN